MPNPKVGTVTFDVGKAVREIKAGKVEFRVDKAGIVHAPIGKASFGAEKLVENVHGAHRRDRARQARGGEGHLPQERHGLEHDGPGVAHRPATRSSRGVGDASEHEREREAEGRSVDELREQARTRATSRVSGRLPRPDVEAGDEAAPRLREARRRVPRGEEHAGAARA